MKKTLTVVLLALAAGSSSAQDAPAPKVELTVLAVKAMPAADGVDPGVGPGLEKVAQKLQRLGFARFESDSTTQREISPGEQVSIPFAGSGRFVVSAKAVEGGSVELEVQEFAPGSDKPCLSQRARVESGRTHVTFCDGVPGKAQTLVFLSKVTSR